MIPHFSDQADQIIWNDFLQKFAINAIQADQFKAYYNLIVQENEKYNITAITGVKEIILDHFSDSLSLLAFYDITKVTSIADIGSGGGFPGIPLAIMLPSTSIRLIEVNLKKVHFLKLVIAQLGLTSVTITTEDWRTFLRTVKDPIEMFVARASLQMDELLRIFKPSSRFTLSTLVYWASKKWIPTDVEREYLNRSEPYLVGDKMRNLCFFSIHSK